ncbi:MAG TPA: hypothetical protein VK837_10215 [Longimicrobiales bacterium]|nr:hypothetical protein [Longimicrobiales bacterium]
MAGTKSRAEAVLRELPSVVDAFVREDIHGDPREIHVLIGPGPEPRDLATDVRDLLEERLGVPIDQRIISIAQLRVAPGDGLALIAGGAAGGALALPARDAAIHAVDTAVPAVESEVRPLEAPAPARREAARPMPGRGAGIATRVVLTSLEVRRESGRVIALVRVDHDGEEFTGEAAEPDLGLGPVRAAARAALGAVEAALEGAAMLELESASVVRALDRDVVLVTAAALAPDLGRSPRHLAGAHSVEARPESAAVLAALKATNRTAEVA